MITRPTRREFLAITALGVSSMAVRTRAQQPRNRRWIDVHHHILPPAYVEAVGSLAIGAPGGRSAAPEWSVELSLETMDRAGIATAMTSLSTPALAPQNDGTAERQRIRRLVRGFNEFSRKIATDHLALSTYPQVLAALMQFAGSSQVVFGTDYPFGAAGTAEATARELEALGLGGGVVDAIGRGNASGLFSTLQTVGALAR